MKEFFTINLPAYLLVCGISYLFLSLCNWEIWIGDWNGFSRFIQAIFMFIGMRIFLED
jgi:hypothetical protein